MRKSKLALALGIVLAISGLAPSAHATASSAMATDSTFRMFNCDGGSAANGLVSINPATLEAANSTSGCGGWSVESNAYNSNDGYTYATLRKVVSNATTWNLGRFDLQGHLDTSFHDGSSSNSKKMTIVDGVTTTSNVNNLDFGLAINPLSGAAYATNVSTGVFYSADLSTATLTKVSNASVYRQMAFSPDGNLYAYDETHDALVILDPTTGSASSTVQAHFSYLFPTAQQRIVNNLSESLFSMYGFAFDSSGTLFMNLKNADMGPPEIFWASSVDQFHTPTMVVGANAHYSLNDGSTYGMVWNQTDPWPFSGNPLVVTYGLNKVIFDTATNGGASSSTFSRFFPPTILNASTPASTNSDISLPTPAARSGYNFDAWYSAASAGTKIGNAGDTYVIPSGQATDITMFARWISTTPTSSPVQQITSPRVTSISGPGSSRVITGSLLANITSATVNGVPVKVISAAGSQVEIASPNPELPVGEYEIVLSGSDGTITWQNGYRVKANPVISAGPVSAEIKATKVIAGFAGDSAVLTGSIKKAIKDAVTGASHVTCVGSSSNKNVTAADRRLALNRAKLACEFVKKMSPSTSTSIAAQPASGLGAGARKVTLTVTK